MAFNLYLVLMLLIKAGAFAVDGFVYDGSSMELNGAAEILDNGLLSLTNTSKFSVGRAFYKLPQKFKDSPNGKVHSFTTTFVFAIVPDKSQPQLNGHGMAFVIAPSKDIPTGFPAQYLGLFNYTNNGDPSNHIVAVEFDTLQSQEFADFRYAKDHVGIDINSLVSAEAAPAGYFTDDGFKNLDLASGEPMQVWVEYDGATNQLDVTLSLLHKSKPDRPLLSYDFDISSIIFEQMYVGFSSSTASFVQQSHYVLGWSFQMDGKAQELDLSKLPSFPGEKRSKIRLTELAIAVSLSIVFLVVIIVSVIFLWRRRNCKFTEILEDWEVQSGSHRFSYEELFVATKGFSEKELLGKGGFGKVYRGVLPVSNEQAAVKRISHDSKQGMKEFVAEIETLGQLRHKNLVRVLGYCRGKGELILVYEYMPNASLDKFLYSTPKLVLNWNQRFKIINDVALALNYLHEEWIQIIIHRDIKASNVLLDGELNGKLGDFGLARCIKHARDPLTTNVAGTLGYIAPELARGGKATTRTDVYAFGAFCLEVACGRRPVVQDAPPIEMILVDWVSECWKEGMILSTVDPKLDGDFNSQEVELVLKLGLVCSNNAAEVRPNMSRILMYLRGDILLPDDLNANVDEEEYAGKHESHAQHDCSMPSLPITESLAFVGR